MAYPILAFLYLLVAAVFDYFVGRHFEIETEAYRQEKSNVPPARTVRIVTALSWPAFLAFLAYDRLTRRD